MGLGHKVHAGDAVLMSGLDGEVALWGTLFWRSFDAHELQQEVRFLRRSLQAVDCVLTAAYKAGTEAYILSVMFGQ